MPEKFSFCIGRPWPGLGPDNICVYAYGTQVHHGTLEQANGMREYVDSQTGEKNFIYKLVQVSENKESV